MKKDVMIDAITGIDEKYLIEYTQYETKLEILRSRKKNRNRSLIVCAACLALAFCMLLVTLPLSFIVLGSKPVQEFGSEVIDELLFPLDQQPQQPDDPDEPISPTTPLYEDLMINWIEWEFTEEAFIALIADNTDDTASIETDGLYDDVSAGGNYVAEFTNWAIDPARKPGDADLVKTEFGYHFMYFVEASGDTTWESEVRSTLASNDYNALVDGIYEDVEEKLESNDTFLKFFADRLEKTISTRF